MFLAKNTLGVIVYVSPKVLTYSSCYLLTFSNIFLYWRFNQERVWYPSKLWQCFTCLSPHIVCWQNEWQGQVCRTDLSGFTVLDALFDVRELLRRRILGCLQSQIRFHICLPVISESLWLLSTGITYGDVNETRLSVIGISVSVWRDKSLSNSRYVAKVLQRKEDDSFFQFWKTNDGDTDDGKRDESVANFRHSIFACQ